MGAWVAVAGTSRRWRAISADEGRLRSPLLPSLLTFVASATLALVLAEGVTRLFVPSPFMLSETHRFDPELGWVQQSSVTLTRRNETGERVRIQGSRLGIRQPPLPYRAEAQTVLVVGDSFTAGTQVSWRETWIGRLQERLNPGHPDVQLVNAGVDGYDLIRGYRMAQRLWPRFRPRHLVLALFVGNDLIDYEDEDLGVRPPWQPVTLATWVQERSYLFHLARAALVPRPPEVQEKALPGWIPESVAGFASLPADKQQHLRQQFAAEELLPALRDGGRRLRSTERVLDCFVRMARAQGASFTLLVIPTKQQAVPAQRAEWIRLHGLTEEQALGPQRELVRWGQAQGVTVVDLTERFAHAQRPETLYWRVNLHCSPRGHAATADAVFPHLEAALKRGETLRAASVSPASVALLAPALAGLHLD